MREMKNSGVAWIGDVPENWETIPNKYLMRKVKAICQKYSNEDVLSLTMNGVIKRDLDNPSGKMPSTFDGYQFVYAGNLLMCLFDIDVTPRCIGLIENDGITSPAYSQFELKRNAFNRYYYYYYLYLDNKKELLHLAKNLRHSFTEEQFGQISTVVPPIEQQHLIANQLDFVCNKVEDLISNQEQQIDKLKQYKQSLITEVVTKGLDPDVPMKDSGIEWIGIISAIHNIYRLKYLLNSQMLYGANEAGSFYTNNAVRYIRITDITEDNKLKDSAENLYLSIEKAKPYILKDKDILFARSGATVGKAFMYLNEYGKSAFAGYLIKAECNMQKLLPEYLFYYTQSSLYEYWKNMIFIQATIQNIGANKYSNMPIIQMSLDEQNQIVKFLDDKCAKIDRLIAIKQEKIDKLNEYKKSLIYEYVTGKKEA